MANLKRPKIGDLLFSIVDIIEEELIIGIVLSERDNRFDIFWADTGSFSTLDYYYLEIDGTWDVEYFNE